ncbi:MAG: hypothetical protein ACLUPE_02890 [Turicibacter sanguinis]|uniref:hypothetical protein n=1 Tax=Turicibacter sanguinis TaxID=154288 RepID=UPI003994261C
MKRLKLKWYALKWKLMFVFFKLTKKKIHLKKYCGKSVKTAQEGNNEIFKRINSTHSMAVCRLGFNELRCLVECIDAELANKNEISSETRQLICHNAGFFPNTNEAMFEFASEMKNALREVDLLAVWDNEMEDFVSKEYCPNAYLCELRALEPYYFETPWSMSLLGKKVLVIHPFAKSIVKQYQKKEKLFPTKKVLPEFNLIALKAVQTIAGEDDNRFSTWFEALQYMYDEAMKIDFDVAIIGCGAYGLPLAVKLKKAGKKAIHMGGATQIMFGIKGKRWDKHEIISSLYNEEWIRPSEEERPQNNGSIENSCYW